MGLCNKWSVRERNESREWECGLCARGMSQKCGNVGKRCGKGKESSENRNITPPLFPKYHLRFLPLISAGFVGNVGYGIVVIVI